MAFISEAHKIFAIQIPANNKLLKNSDVFKMMPEMQYINFTVSLDFLVLHYKKP